MTDVTELGALLATRQGKKNRSSAVEAMARRLRELEGECERRREECRNPFLRSVTDGLVVSPLLETALSVT